MNYYVKFIGFLSLLMLGILVEAQQASTAYHASLMAQEQVSRLKQGALLVMLDNPVNSIQALRSKGMYRKAEKLEIETKVKNQEIIHAFKKSYFFSLVYFFTSDHLPKIKQKRWEDVVFMDDKGQSDSSIRVDSDFALLAHVGSVHRKSQPSLNFETGINVTALVIRDTRFHPLESPFPYKVRTYEGSGIRFLRRPYERAVRILNSELFTFFGH